MGIKTIIILSILAMAFGVFLLFVWIDQRRQQKRLRAIARYNRERQQQNRVDLKGPRVVEVGNKRMIIDPLVADVDQEEEDEDDLDPHFSQHSEGCCPHHHEEEDEDFWESQKPITTLKSASISGGSPSSVSGRVAPSFPRGFQQTSSAADSLSSSFDDSLSDDHSSESFTRQESISRTSPSSSSTVQTFSTRPNSSSYNQTSSSARQSTVTANAVLSSTAESASADHSSSLYTAQRVQSSNFSTAQRAQAVQSPSFSASQRASAPQSPNFSSAQAASSTQSSNFSSAQAASPAQSPSFSTAQTSSATQAPSFLTTQTSSAAQSSSSTSANNNATQTSAASNRIIPEFLTLSLMAEKGHPFGGYDLLQAILDSGLRHGERQIFHRYDSKEPTKILFSLASIAKPGTFSLESIGSFSTPGLIFIFEIDRTPELLNSFELLLETARQLSDDLGADLLDDQRQPLSTEKIQALRQILREITPITDYAD